MSGVNINGTSESVRWITGIFNKSEELGKLICSDFFKQIGEESDYTRLMENKDPKLNGTIAELCEYYSRSMSYLKEEICQAVMEKISLFFQYLDDDHAPNRQSSIWYPIRDVCGEKYGLTSQENEDSNILIYLGVAGGVALSIGIGIGIGYYAYNHRYYNKKSFIEADETPIETKSTTDLENAGSETLETKLLSSDEL